MARGSSRRVHVRDTRMILAACLLSVFLLPTGIGLKQSPIPRFDTTSHCLSVNATYSPHEFHCQRQQHFRTVNSKAP